MFHPSFKPPISLIITALSGALFATGCGHNEKPSSPRVSSESDRQVQTIHFESESATLAEAKKALVYCADKSKCPEAAVLLAIVNGEEGAQCSGFLIDQTHIMTNSHCLGRSGETQELKIGDSCKDRVIFHFATTRSKPHKSVGCSKVVQKSTIAPSTAKDFTAPDYAVLELETPVIDRAPLQASPNGLTGGASLSVLKIDPLPDSFGGTLEVAQGCKVSTSHILAPNASENSPIRILTNCNVIAGNSGSPVVDEGGRIVGILHAGFKGDSEHILSILRNLTDYETPTQIRTFGIATNINCVSYGSRTSLPSNCAQNATDLSDTSQLDRRMRDQLVKDFSAEFARFSQQNQLSIPGRTFEWAITKVDLQDDSAANNSNRSTQYLFRPRCFAPVQGWLIDFRKQTLIRGDYYESQVTAEIPTAAFSFGLRITEDLEFESNLKHEADLTRKIRVSFSPEEVARNNANSRISHQVLGSVQVDVLTSRSGLVGDHESIGGPVPATASRTLQLGACDMRH